MIDLSTSMTGDLADQIIVRNDVESAAKGFAKRYKRRARRKADEKGLGTDEQLAELAKAYLEAVAKYFPKAVERGVVGPVSADCIAVMIADLKRRRQVGEKVNEVVFKAIIAKLGLSRLATAYARYSCDNSNPRSIADQVVNCVRKAADKGEFIPWEALLVDYAISGRTRNRPGYLAFRALLADHSSIGISFIDDFSRASRDMVEWWDIAAFAKQHNKPVIGASDAFDTSGMQSNMVVLVHGMFSTLLIESLQQKVGRGMGGAAKRGLCLGKPPLGFTRRALADGKGAFLKDADGNPVYEWAPDPDTRGYVELMFKLFVVDRWTCSQIADHFNDELRVEDWEGWTSEGIRKLLLNPAVIGCFIWNRSRQFYDQAQGRWRKVRKPRNEWIVRYSPEKAIVPVRMWAEARKLIAASRRRNPTTGRIYHRAKRQPQTLLPDYWFCDCCDVLLKLVRSSGRHQQFGNATLGVSKRKCKLKSSKSVRLIETAFLKALNERVLNEEVVHELVRRANRHLEQIASQPIPDLANKKRRQAKLRGMVGNLTEAIGESSDKEIRKQLTLKLATINRELTALTTQVDALAAADKKKVKPLKPDAVRDGLRRIHEVLHHERPRAVAVLKRLTGPVRVREEQVPGSNRKRWIATFTPQLGGLIDALTGSDSSAATLAINHGMEPIEVVIDQVPRYERDAAEIQKLIDAGHTVSAVVAMKKWSREGVKAALDFARTGQRPDFSKKRPQRAGTRKWEGTKYKSISAEVVRLREQECLSFCAIAEQLDVGLATVTTAYDYARPEALAASISAKRRVTRGKVSNLSKAKIDRMKQLIKAGHTASDIGAEVGCSTTTVGRYRKKFGVPDK